MDVARPTGADCIKDSRGVAVADFNGDGRLDLVINNNNATPTLYLNNVAKSGNAVVIELKAQRSNRDAIGAIARLWIGKTVMVRQVNPAGGYLAQSSRVLHFGLGDASKVDSIAIRWPRGTNQSLISPAINTLLSIREPQ